MVLNASSATGIPNDTAKKRKGAPSEIFTTPVPATDETIYNGGRMQTAPKKVFVSRPNQVGSPN